MITYIVVGTILFTVLVSVFNRGLLSRMLTGSKKQQEMAAELRTTGSKARAQIAAITPTGTVVNQIYVRTTLRFEISPLHGGPPFDGEKTVFIDQTNQPRVGDVWPCWYVHDDPTVFALGQPTGDAREHIQVFREFGIPHPLDT